MQTREQRDRSEQEWLTAVTWAGPVLLLMLFLAWVALVFAVLTDPCDYDCGDLGRGRTAALYWALTLPGLPLSGWLTARFLARRRDRNLRFPIWAVALVIGLIGIVLIALAFYMVTRGAFFAAVAVWPGLIGAASLHSVSRIHRGRRT